MCRGQPPASDENLVEAEAVAVAVEKAELVKGQGPGFQEFAKLRNLFAHLNFCDYTRDTTE